MTSFNKINIPSAKIIRVLVGPLDWGLGHLTRCVPIINAFQDAGAAVVVACNVQQAHLLRLEFPLLEFLHLEGYNLSYGRSKWHSRWRILLQVPKILTSIKRERRWLNSILKHEKFDLVISDNRFGLNHPAVCCIFLTHQLRIRIPFSSLLENQIQKLNYHYINQFNECWIPDFENEGGMAGELSHPEKLPKIKVNYVGALSRFQPANNSSLQSLNLLILLSGPEPQRSILEKVLINELTQYKGSAIVVRGLPGGAGIIDGFGKIVFHNHLPTKQLNELIESAQYVISRSGYSTIMDLFRLRKKSILIPTPGQTEQEYLAEYLMRKNLCLSIEQHFFSLPDALDRAEKFEYANMHRFQQSHVEAIIREFMKENSMKS